MQNAKCKISFPFSVLRFPLNLTIRSWGANLQQRVEDVVQRDDPDKVKETDCYDYRHKYLYETLAPIAHIVRCKERADHITHAVYDTEGVIYIAHNHKYRQRERCGKQNYKTFNGICRNQVHSHKPQRYGKDKVTDTNVDVASVEADK